MSQATDRPDVLDGADLREVDRRVLEFLSEGRVTPAYARDRLDGDGVGEYSRGYVQQRLARLAEHGHVTNLGNGLYRLVDDPRDDAEPADAESRVATLEAELQECREELRRERSAGGARLDDQSIRRLENAVSTALSALQGTRPSVDQARAEIEAAQEVLQDDAD